MFKMFASENRETVFPYHYFLEIIAEIIIPRDCESFLTLILPFLTFLAEPFRYEI